MSYIFYHTNKQSDSFAHSDSSDSVLYHHGILGQRWGVRRYQNEDGSLTTAGKARYGVEAAKAGVKGFGKTIGGLFKRGFKAAKNATVETAKEMRDKTKEELDKEKLEFERKFDAERTSKREELLKDARENGKYDLEFLEEIQNDYDDQEASGVSQEEINKDMLDRYSTYLRQPTTWMRAHRDYYGLSKEKAADKVVEKLKEDLGSWDKVDDDELIQLVLYEHEYDLKLASQKNTDEILDLAEKKFKKGG